MPPQKADKQIDLQKVDLRESELPLPFANLVRVHADIMHSTITFGYMESDKEGKPTPRAAARVAMPLQTLLALRDLINKVLANMEADGVIELERPQERKAEDA